MHDTPSDVDTPKLALPPASSAVPALAEAIPESPDVPAKSVLARVAWWPFIAYGLAWVALCATTGIVLYRGLSVSAPIDQPAYPYIVVAGLLLAASGPVVGVGAWLTSRVRVVRGERAGLLSRALLRAGVLALAGTTLWWVVLTTIDAYRLGLLPWPR